MADPVRVAFIPELESTPTDDLSVRSIEAQIDVKTTDGYLIRLFSIGFTKRRPNQVKKTTYAKSSQIREIRKKMFEVMQREASSCDLKQLVHKLVPEVIGREIEKASQGIYPLQNCYVRKVRLTCPYALSHAGP